MLTAVKDLPSDADWAAKMITDPPVYAPWLLFGACVFFLAWVFWHRGDGDDVTDRSHIAQTTAGTASHAIVNHGTVNIGATPLVATETTRRAVILAQLTQLYISSHDGIPSRMMAGLELPPTDFLNRELQHLNERWRVKIVSGPNAETYDVS